MFRGSPAAICNLLLQLLYMHATKDACQDTDFRTVWDRMFEVLSASSDRKLKTALDNIKDMQVQSSRSISNRLLLNTTTSYYYLRALSMQNPSVCAPLTFTSRMVCSNSWRRQTASKVTRVCRHRSWRTRSPCCSGVSSNSIACTTQTKCMRSRNCPRHMLTTKVCVLFYRVLCYSEAECNAMPFSMRFRHLMKHINSEHLRNRPYSRLCFRISDKESHFLEHLNASLFKRYNVDLHTV